MNNPPSFSEDPEDFTTPGVTSAAAEQHGPPSGAPRRSGNEVIWTGNPCWRAMIPTYLRGMLFAIVISAIAIGLKFAGVLSTFLVIVIIAMALVGAWVTCYFVQRMTVYTLTRARVLKKSGIINVRKEQARLEMITNIIIDRNLSQRMLGIGDLDIDTANDSSESLVWWGIRDPYKVEALIDSLRAGDYDSLAQEDDDFSY